jgi:hypothetical protein
VSSIPIFHFDLDIPITHILFVSSFIFRFIFHVEKGTQTAVAASIPTASVPNTAAASVAAASIPITAAVSIPNTAIASLPIDITDDGSIPVHLNPDKVFLLELSPLDNSVYIIFLILLGMI